MSLLSQDGSNGKAKAKLCSSSKPARGPRHNRSATACPKGQRDSAPLSAQPESIIQKEIRHQNGMNTSLNGYKISTKNTEKDEEAIREVPSSKSEELAKQNEDSEESSSEEEDETGDLLTDEVEKKIFKTLSSIKNKDPIVYQPSHNFFDQDDFHSAMKLSITDKKKTKPLTYKDFVRQELLKSGSEGLQPDEEQQQPNSTFTYVQEQQDLKKAFLMAADDSINKIEEEGGFMELKEKTQDEMNREESEYQNFLIRNKDKLNVDDDAIIRNYWADEAELDEKQRFLRDYILNQRWKDVDTSGVDPKIEVAPDEKDDEAHLEQTENFESNYNFRFEETGGTQIQSHSRKVEDSLRLKQDRRKRKRENKKLRKQEEKIQRQEELKKIKSVKKREMIEKMNKIAEICGDESIDPKNFGLDKDFDESLHDEAMNKIFENYEDTLEPLPKEQLLQIPQDLANDLEIYPEQDPEPKFMTKRQKRLTKRAKKKNNDAYDDGLPYAPISDSNDVETFANETDIQVPNDHSANETEEPLWWLCDECSYGILPGNKVYECKVCENYSLCSDCRPKVHHEHPMKRKKVLENEMPPEQSLKTLGDTQKNMREKLLEEYFQLDYEDLIGDDIPTRFKYEKVKPNSYGLTTEEILTKTDGELNQIISLKKLSAYRKDEKITRKQMKSNLWKRKGISKLEKKSSSKQSPQSNKAITNDTENNYKAPAIPSDRLKFIHSAP